MQGYMNSNNASIKQNNGGNRRINIKLFKLNPTNESIVIAFVCKKRRNAFEVQVQEASSAFSRLKVIRLS